MSRKRGNGHEEELPVVASTATTEAAASEPEAGDAAAETGGELAPVAGDELEELRRERDELRATLLRRRADFENYRKRVERERGTVATDAEAGLLRQLLGTVDNLERALAAHETGPGLREGVELTHHALVTLLTALGVEALDPLGQPFDPAEHQALLHEPVPGVAGGTVAEVYRKGFRYQGRLLRPALVKVASDGVEAGQGGGDLQ